MRSFIKHGAKISSIHSRKTWEIGIISSLYVTRFLGSPFCLKWNSGITTTPCSLWQGSHGRHHCRGRSLVSKLGKSKNGIQFPQLTGRIIYPAIRRKIPLVRRLWELGCHNSSCWYLGYILDFFSFFLVFFVFRNKCSLGFRSALMVFSEGRRPSEEGLIVFAWPSSDFNTNTILQDLL